MESVIIIDKENVLCYYQMTENWQDGSDSFSLLGIERTTVSEGDKIKFVDYITMQRELIL